MIGTMVGHYRITAKLGEGGMGAVFLAEDTRLKRRVAIKCLSAESAADPDRRQRFLKEARVASALNHPRVCVIYDVGETDEGSPYIAMEYVEGESLESLARKAPLDIPRLVEIGIQIADALDAAHAQRIVHRDIKPANININQRGEVKVLDFGIAKRLPTSVADLNEASLDLGQTQHGKVLGTPSYMSPEQVLGRSLDHRTDIFSLGVLLYELATRQLPFAGGSFSEIFNAIIHFQPPPIARLNSDVPPELERITLKCLQKSSDRRYQSAHELLVDLRRLKHELDGMLDRAKPAGRQFSHNSSFDEIGASDIFVSCAQLDDQPLEEGKEGWVSQFRRNLKVRIEQLSGDSVQLSSYPMLPGNEPVAEGLFDHLPKARTMVTVLSPPFAKSAGCRKGVQTFVDENRRTGDFLVADRPRLFKVVKTPIDDRDLPPPIGEMLRRLPGFEFFEREPSTGRIREFCESFGEAARQRYYEKIYDLAFEIAQVLQRQRSIPARAGRPPAGARRIYLAETTSDLQAEYDRLRRELTEQGHCVLPNFPLPLVAAELRETIRGYLQQCDLAIHLIGERYGLVPEDSDQSVVVIQNALAAEASGRAPLDRIIWMRRNLSPSDQRQVEFVRQLREDPAVQLGADVVEDTLENLKEVLEEKWSRQESPSPPAAPGPGSGGSDAVPRIYLICDQKDETAIEWLEDFFYDQGIDVSLPDFGDDLAVVNQVHRRQLEDCDAVLVYYGAAGNAWVDIKRRDLVKAIGYRGGRPIDHQLVYIAPPLDRRKERFKTHAAEVVRQGVGDPDVSQLAAFADRIKRGRTAPA